MLSETYLKQRIDDAIFGVHLDLCFENQIPTEEAKRGAIRLAEEAAKELGAKWGIY